MGPDVYTYTLYSYTYHEPNYHFLFNYIYKKNLLSMPEGEKVPWKLRFQRMAHSYFSALAL